MKKVLIFFWLQKSTYIIFFENINPNAPIVDITWSQFIFLRGSQIYEVRNVERLI